MGAFFLVMGVPYAIFIIYIIVHILVTLSRKEKEAKSNLANGAFITSELIFTIIGPIIGFCRFDQYGSDIPFAKQHVLVIILLSAVSSAAFWIARATQNTTNLFVRIFLSAGILQGIILCVIVCIHFAGYMLLGVLIPLAGFELICPFVALFILIRELYFYNRVSLDMEELLPYRSELGFEPVQYKIFQQPFITRLFIYAGIAILLAVAEMSICYAIGLQPDSIIRAFTESSGFTFSR